LHDKNISIIDGENCNFGIESTVLKIMTQDGKPRIFLLRMGSVSEKNIRTVLAKSEKYADTEVINAKKEHSIAKEVNAEAPGQLLKHYSPYVETYLVEFLNRDQQVGKECSLDLAKSVLIDFGGLAQDLEKDFLGYFSLSDKGDMNEAMSKLYDTLRIAENLPGAQTILIVNLQSYYEKFGSQVEELPEFLETVYDKSFRSASGKKIVFNPDTKKFNFKE